MSIASRRPLQYLRARSVAEALEMHGGRPEVRYIAGGTDLIVRLKERSEDARALVSLRGVAELRGVAVDGVGGGEGGGEGGGGGEGWPGGAAAGSGNGAGPGRGLDNRAPLGPGGLEIGGALPLTDVAEHPAVRRAYPVLAEAIGTMASEQIRNVATLGGNICRASPCADSAPALMVLEARVRLVGPEGAREVAVGEVFTGPGSTVLTAGELLASIVLEAPREGLRAVYFKQGRVRVDLAFASLAAAVELEPDGLTCRRAMLAAGAVAPTPVRLPGAEAWLAGRRLEPEVVARAAELARDEVRPISDLRASADYRRHITGVLCRRALAHLVDAEGSGA